MKSMLFDTLHYSHFFVSASYKLNIIPARKKQDDFWNLRHIIIALQICIYYVSRETL